MRIYSFLLPSWRYCRIHPCWIQPQYISAFWWMFVVDRTEWSFILPFLLDPSTQVAWYAGTKFCGRSGEGGRRWHGWREPFHCGTPAGGLFYILSHIMVTLGISNMTRADKSFWLPRNIQSPYHQMLIIHLHAIVMYEHNSKVWVSIDMHRLIATQYRTVLTITSAFVVPWVCKSLSSTHPQFSRERSGHSSFDGLWSQSCIQLEEKGFVW